MSTRNPMNDRYNSEEKKSASTRKSAASATPKAKAGASVYEPDAEVIKKQKEKEARAEERAAARKYNNPTDPKYKRWVIVFIACLVVGFGMSFSFTVWGDVMPDWAYGVFSACSYSFILLALIIWFMQLRPMRAQYKADMEAKEREEKKAARQAAGRNGNSRKRKK